MTDVVNFDGGKYTPPKITIESNEAVISHLERLLELAKNGQVTGIMSTVAYLDTTFSIEMSGGCVSRGMIGNMEIAKAHLLRDLIEEVE